MMANPETEMLRREIESLKVQIADLQALHKRDFERVNKLLEKVYTAAYQRIANLYDIVWPIEAKIFPRAKETRRQMKSIIGPSDIFTNDKWDKRQD